MILIQFKPAHLFTIPSQLIYMEQPYPELNTSLPPLLNTTAWAQSIYLDDSQYTDLELELQYQNKISQLENQINSFTANEILIQSQPVKLVDGKDLELSFDRNLRQYYLTFIKNKADEASRRKIYFENLENVGLLQNRVGAISPIAAIQQIPTFDMFSTSQGLTPRIEDEIRLLRPPNFLNFNMKPQSSLSESRSIEEQPSQSHLSEDFENFENQIKRLQVQLLQSDSLENLQLLKVTPCSQSKIPMIPEHNSQQQSKWQGILSIDNQKVDVCIQTQSSCMSVDNKENIKEKIVQRVVEKVVQRIVEVPFETLLIIQKEAPTANEGLGGEFNQFEYNQDNGEQDQIEHTDQRTRIVYNKAISQNNFLRQQVITLIEQLEEYKMQSQKDKNIISQLQLRINNSANRDFYKVKLSDLERKISQKTIIYEELQNNIETLYRESNPHNQEMNQIIKRYQFTFVQMTEQIQVLKNKVYELREIQSSRIQNQGSKYAKQIDIKNIEIEELHRANQEYRLQLQEEREANSDLKNIVQKLWEQTEELSSQLGSSHKELQEIDQNQSNLTKDKQDIEDMNSLVSVLTQEIYVIKKELQLKQKKQEQMDMDNRQYEHRIIQYQEQIHMQMLTIQQFKTTCQKSQEYCMMLNQQIRNLRRELQKFQFSNNQQKPNFYKNLTIRNQTSALNYQNISNQKEKQKRPPSHITEFRQLLNINNDVKDKNSSRCSSAKNSSIQSNRMQIQQFVQSLQTSQFSSQIIQQFVKVIKDANSDIIILQSQNKQLQNMILEYEKLLQLPTKTHIKLSEDEILSLIIQNQKLEKQLSEAQASNIDLNLFQEIVNELQKQKYLNAELKMQLQKIKAELLKYQCQIFQKTEAISFLNLQLIKISGEKLDFRNGKAGSIIEKQLFDYKHELESTLIINRTLEVSIQKLSKIKNQQINTLNLQIVTLQTVIIPNLNKKIRQLEIALEAAQKNNLQTSNQIQFLHRDKNQVHSKSAINLIEKYVLQNDSLDIKPIRLQNGTMRRLNAVQLCLDEIKGQNLSKKNVFYIMYRLTELISQKIKRKNFRLVSPSSVVVLNYSQHKPELIQIMILPQEQESVRLFCPPQVLRGEQTTQYSCSWNIGVVFDYLINGQLFFSSRSEILNDSNFDVNQDQFVFKNSKFGVLKQILENSIIKSATKRQKVSKTVQLLKKQIYKGI